MRFLTKKRTRKRIDSFVKQYATDEHVLDIGAGHSPYSDSFPNRTTLDNSNTHNPDIVADLHNLPIEDESYSFILCTEVLEHLYDPKKAVSELERVLKPGGTMILTTRFIFPIHDAPHDYFRFTEYGLKSLFSDWEMLVFEPEVDTQGAIADILRSIFYQTQMNRFFKAIFLLIGFLLDQMPRFIKEEYFDKAHRDRSGTPILTTGYHMVCRKIG